MKKRNCIITGGAGFLGTKFCNFFSKNDFHVICIDKDNKKLRKLENKKNITTINLDITNEIDVKKTFKFLKKFKNFDCLINNAAIDAVPKNNSNKYEYPSLDVWKKEIDVGLLASFLMIKYFGTHMCKQKFGSIINIGSDLSVLAPNQDIYKSSYNNYYKPPTYSVVKFGLLGLTKYYASLFASKNVRVNMVSPGPVKNIQKKKLISEIKNLIPMKKMSKPEYIFGVLKFLAEDESNFITGQNILVDGGKTII